MGSRVDAVADSYLRVSPIRLDICPVDRSAFHAGLVSY